ncbi:hypothetical protein Tco_0111406 [Tanacetum coccineum]
MDEVLHDIVPKIASNATNDLIEDDLPTIVANAIKKEIEASQAVVPALISSSIADLKLWNVLKDKFEKSSASASSCKDGQQQQQQQDWDAWVDDPVVDEDEVIPEDETPELIKEFHNVNKRVPTIFNRERMKETLRDMLSNQNLNEPSRYIYNKDLFFLKYENTEEKRYVLSLHKIHVIPYPEEDLEEKMNRWVRKEFKMFNEEARLSIQHWKDTWHKRMYKINHRKLKDDPEEYFFNYKIVEVVRVITKQQHRFDFMEQIIMMRENDKPDSFSEADFKYLNNNDIEDIYYLCLNKKVNYRENNLLNSLLTFIRSCVIWERVHDFQLGIESYPIKINLTAPMFIFPGIETCDPYSIVDEPRLGLIYLNIKEGKRVMDLVEIVKFCDATLEKVLKEVKLKIFKSEF